jgi:hypothetical protein
VLSAEQRLLLRYEDNGRVFHCSLLPYRHAGWFMVVSLLYGSGTDTRLWCAALLSKTAVACLLAGTREPDTVKAIASEMLDWSYGEMIRNQNKALIVPTAHGYFFGKWNEAEDALVLDAWSPDRVLRARETQVLDKLRKGRTVMAGEALTS